MADDRIDEDFFECLGNSTTPFGLHPRMLSDELSVLFQGRACRRANSLATLCEVLKILGQYETNDFQNELFGEVKEGCHALWLPKICWLGGRCYFNGRV